MGEKYYSWEVINQKVVLKQTDKSVFDYNQTGIPIEIRSFWDAEGLKKGERVDLCLSYKRKLYPAYIQMENSSRLRTKLFWTRELIRCIHHESEFPYMRFEKKEKGIYYMDLIYERNTNDAVIDDDVKWYEVVRNAPGGLEGRAITYFTTKYERNPKNRKAAIKIHGLRCKVCGFDFQERYGILGEGFIEIHHVKPLSSLNEVVEINPETDLRPVCSNCHRMIHRIKGKVYSLEELKSIIQENTKEEQ